MSRTLNVVRMQLINRNTYIWIPLLVLAGAFVLSLAVYALIPGDGVKVGGGAQAPLWYFLVVGVQSLTLTFPFSQAMSVTRREFFLGTYLTAAITAAILSVVFVIGGLIERATDGWGMNGWMFYGVEIWQGGPLAAFAFYFLLAMTFFSIGFWSATLYKRFGAFWLTATLITIGAVLVAAMWLIGRTDSWGAIFGWFAGQTALSLALWSILVIAVLAGTSFIPLRRAVP
ncbi:Phosphotransferase system cellobiose-specific component IIC [Microbacterium sp. C448]|uniref:hypothetical protein n=1 Tax=Microbacterium TaxID=33882 RepID=UPI0003DE31A9|nr:MULTISPECIES: hypothetical protein [Microbacterium]CDK01092.1 Phosphotransferase system cellobiose-specific component IIC [Microbacterium sp. C448]